MLTGHLLERGAVRHTPAGVPVLEFRIGHESCQQEAGTERRVECEMTCKAVGSLTGLLADVIPGQCLTLTGFIAAKSLKSRTPVLHVNTIEFLEGN